MRFEKAARLSSSRMLVLALVASGCGTDAGTLPTGSGGSTSPGGSGGSDASGSGNAASAGRASSAGGTAGANASGGTGGTVSAGAPAMPAGMGGGSGTTGGTGMNGAGRDAGGTAGAAAGMGAVAGETAMGGTGGTMSSGGMPGAAGAGEGVVWPNADSSANSDPWLSENHDRITQLRPKVLVINLETSTSASQAQTLVDKHIAALKEASSFHKYKDANAEPALAYELLKIANASKGSRIDYNSWNTQEFADSNLQIKDPADPNGPNLTLCQLFEKGVINEVWCMASSDPKCGETQEAKQAYDSGGKKIANKFLNVSNGDSITSLGCKVTARITDFNSGRGTGCHQHAMGHAWERYMDVAAVPALGVQAKRFLNFDLDTRVFAPFKNFYSACKSNGSQLTDCMVWDSQTHVKSGPSASNPFDIADMSEGCGNAHFYANTTGTYSYDANMPDPEVLTSCENYGLHNGPDGKDLTTTYTNAMTDQLYGRSGRDCPADQPACDDDCGGHGTTYLYQNFPSYGTAATNADGTPMHNWWVYLFY